MENTEQVKTWTSEFGAEYTERNTFNPEELDNLNLNRYGISKSALNDKFLGEFNLYESKILELGCNVGNQLRLLQRQGYKFLYGLEAQNYAVEKSKSLSKDINIIQGLGDDIPYRDSYFNLVFTHGVLIHIAPENIGTVMDEIYRCSKEYIWGLEYYNDKYVEIDYRGNNQLLWKGNFAQMYLDRFPDLELVKEERYTYLDNEGNIDSMFLLRKTKQ